ncbi:MAG: hypothetical protein CMF41_01385 [Legionellales bacterium]|nr:hypothetical protein [Legionellales bacterium]OUX66110.1 MAG: hypothetical protein CBE41_00595 [Gammaproteobacteria bacterium TMED281]|tara:strand:+ start:53 stop:721 length:669 start_codon:yes stop_codon:yes gene_type:complete
MYLPTAILIFFSALACAEQPLVELPHISVDPSNQESVFRGAVFFAAKCQSCHSMAYLRYDKISNEAGVKYGMAPTWPAGAWMGHPPPDLSLVAITRGSDWVYGYLKGYYKEGDGYQNLVEKNTRMPNPYPALQGDQVLTMSLESIEKERPRLFRALRLEKAGTIPAHDFNTKVLDLVHYLVYASDPSVIERKSIAPYVLAFLMVFALSTFLLYRSFKKDLDQ